MDTEGHSKNNPLRCIRKYTGILDLPANGKLCIVELEVGPDALNSQIQEPRLCHVLVLSWVNMSSWPWILMPHFSRLWSKPFLILCFCCRRPSVVALYPRRFFSMIFFFPPIRHFISSARERTQNLKGQLTQITKTKKLPHFPSVVFTHEDSFCVYYSRFWVTDISATTSLQ